MKTNEQRINNIIGQLEGIKKMLENKKRDCFSLITQLKATKSALGSLMEKIIVDEFDHCLITDKINSKEKMEKLFNEIIKNK